MNNSENITKFENNELQITPSHITLLLSASTVIKQSAKLSDSVAMLSLIRDAIVKNFLLVFKKKLRKPPQIKQTNRLRKNNQIKHALLHISLAAYRQ